MAETFGDTKLTVGNVELTYSQLDDAAHAMVHKPGIDNHTLGLALGLMEVLAQLREATIKLRQIEQARADFIAPPSGWYTFGTHAGWDSGTIPRLEFSGEQDESGDPLFERPVP